MLESTIKFWEPVLTGCSANPVPSVYIEPDVDLLSLFKENNNLVECTVTGTDNDAYENKTFIATVDRSANMPNNRPNYYTVTGLYILTFTNYSSEGSAQTFWNGYPKTAGKVVFRTGPYQSYTTVPGTVVDALSATSPAVPEKQIETIKTALPEVVVENKKRLFVSNRTLIMILVFLILVMIYLFATAKN